MFRLFVGIVLLNVLTQSTYSQPILSINQTNIIQCNQTTISQPTNQCNQCNQTVALSYPSDRSINCRLLNNRFNLWYSTSVNQTYSGYDIYYISNNQTIKQCNSSSLVASFSATSTQCSNTSLWNRSFFILNQTIITNTPTIDQPINQLVEQSTCNQTCSNNLTCPVNTTQSLTQSNYQVTLSIPCPANCDPSFATRFDDVINQCLNTSNNQADKLCACYSTSYFAKRASGCYVDMQSINQLDQIAANYTRFCSVTPISQSSSSSTGSSSSSSSSSSTGEAPAQASHGIDEGALIGGLLGGLGGIIIMICVLRWCMRHQKGTNIERFRNQQVDRTTQSNNEMAKRRPINQVNDESDDEVLSDEDSDDFESDDDEEDQPVRQAMRSKV